MRQQHLNFEVTHLGTLYETCLFSLKLALANTAIAACIFQVDESETLIEK